MALNRTQLYVKPNGENLELVVGRKQTLTFHIVDADGALRDLTSDSLEVVAKGSATGSLTFTFTAQANQTTTGKGKADLVCPAAQLTQAETVTIDLALGDEVIGAFTAALVASDAE
jgi:hypothetical protein